MYFNIFQIIDLSSNILEVIPDGTFKNCFSLVSVQLDNNRLRKLGRCSLKRRTTKQFNEVDAPSLSVQLSVSSAKSNEVDERMSCDCALAWLSQVRVTGSCNLYEATPGIQGTSDDTLGPKEGPISFSSLTDRCPVQDNWNCFKM